MENIKDIIVSILKVDLEDIFDSLNCTQDELNIIYNFHLNKKFNNDMNHTSNTYYMIGCYFYRILNNFEQAFQLFEKASKLNHSHSINMLGQMYRVGHHVNINFSEAIQLFEKAASLNNNASITNLAYM